MALVFPSYFNVEDSDDAVDILSNNITLKIGQVIKANFPDESKNKNSFITYDVFYQEQRGKEIYNLPAYDCIPVQAFGSAADFLEYSYRTNVSEDGNQDDLLTEGANVDLSSDEDAKKLMGAAVLIAFIGGDTSNGVILGALPNFFLDKNKQYVFQTKDLKKFLNFAFNGIKVNINNDGELLLAVNGPTLDNGKLDTDASEKEKIGSFIKINKEGEIIISTTTKAEEEDGFIKPPDVDKADNKITIKKDGSIEIMIDEKSAFTLKKTDKDTEMTVGDGSVSATVAEELKDLYGKLKDYIEGAKVPTGMGPSGTIQAGSGPAPSWNDKIVSNKVKFPKN